MGHDADIVRKNGPSCLAEKVVGRMLYVPPGILSSCRILKPLLNTKKKEEEDYS